MHCVTRLYLATKRYPQCTLEKEFCEKYKIAVGNHWLIKTRGKLFHVTISGTKSSKRISIPRYLFDKLSLSEGTVLRLDFLQKAKSRSGKPTLIRKRNKEFLDLFDSLPNIQTHLSNELMVFSISQNKLLVCCKGSSKDIIIPRYIPLDEKTFEIFGLYQGEGTKRQQRDCAQVGFVNSCPELIEICLKYFESVFGVPRSKWVARIQYSGNKKTEKQLLNYWNQLTKISISNFRKTAFRPGSLKRFAPNGVLKMIISSVPLTEVVLGILKDLHVLALRKKSWAAAFLRGILAADAHVKLVKWPNKVTLSMIEIALENASEVELYSRFFQKLNIETRIYLKEGKMNVMNWNNLDKLAHIDAFRLHPKKYKDFVYGYNSHSKTTSFLPEP